LSATKTLMGFAQTYGLRFSEQVTEYWNNLDSPGL